MSLPALSYSSIKLFDTCPRKYEAEKVTKEIKFTDNQHTLYGKELHTAAEEFMRDGKALDPKFKYISPFLDRLKKLPGEVHCELKMGLKKQDGRLVACDFFDEEVYFRGIADLVILNGTKGFLVDYKTSKNSRYADVNQLALMAACLFAKYEELESIKAGLLFVVTGELIQAEYERVRAFDIFSSLHPTLTRMIAAHESGVFNPQSNGLCRNYCAVTRCEHCGG